MVKSDPPAIACAGVPCGVAAPATPRAAMTGSAPAVRNATAATQKNIWESVMKFHLKKEAQDRKETDQCGRLKPGRSSISKSQ
jgi:hypothetical protein